jgi:hypothetical protein
LTFAFTIIAATSNGTKMPIVSHPIAAAFLVVLFTTITRAASPPVANREPLGPTPFVALPLGSVRPAGWLLGQLELQRDGLTGHAETVIPQLGPASGWLGGTGRNAESWEKGPYYVKGLVALAYTLDDPELKKKAQKWIDWSINSQRPDGFFGPASNDDWWPRMVMTYALRQYGEATGDPRVVPMLQKYLHYMAANLPKKPLNEWGKARAGDMIDTAFWVFNRTGDQECLRAADLLHAQAYDWTDIFTRNRFLEFGNDFMPKHAVNVTQALKMPPVWYQRSNAAADRDAFAIGMTHLLRGTTLPLDVPTGTEMLSGRSAIQGVETCTVVEQMLSDETAVAILGDPAIADGLERVAYNAMPGAMTKDLKLYQYYTPTNNVIAIRGSQGFGQDYADGLMPGPVSGFPCCCYNLHMGWPMLVQHMWMKTNDGGLAAVVYGPTEVNTTLPGAGAVKISETTDYPFDEGVHLLVSIARPATFPLKLRIPAWCASATLAVNGQSQPKPAAGTFVTVHRQWKDGDEIDLTFPMPLTTIPGVNHSASIARGPLVFSLKMPQQPKITKPGPDGFVQLELTSPDPWNFALAVDPANPAATVTVHTGPMPAGNPFDPETTPVTLTVPGRRVPSWGLAWTGRAAEDPPVSPVASDEPVQIVTLVPFGAQTLRVTTFPLLGRAATPSESYKADFRDTDAPGWVAYGGAWFVRDGQYHSAPTAANGNNSAGVKSVATDTDFADLVYDADVTPAAAGDTGLIFRVTHPAIGTNAFDGYYVGLSPGDGRVVLGSCTAADNQWKALGQSPITVKAGVPVHLRVIAVGSDIRVFVGGAAQPALKVTDDTHARGAIGVRQYASDPKATVAAFANIAARRAKAGE